MGDINRNKMNWIIEKDIFECEANLTKALANGGISAGLVSPIELVKKYFYHHSSGKPYAPCFFYGGIRNSITFHNGFYHSCEEVPMSPTLSDFNWSNYAWALGKTALNHSYILTTVGQILSDYYGVCSHIETRDGVFIKPNLSTKPFIAQCCFTKQDAEECLKGQNPASIIMLAHVQTIVAEYRFVVVNKKVITGSRYMMGPNIAFSPDCNPDARKLAQEVATNMPDGVIQDPGYIIDVALINGGHPKVLELNALCTSDWYLSDCNKIVEAINEI